MRREEAVKSRAFSNSCIAHRKSATGDRMRGPAKLDHDCCTWPAMRALQHDDVHLLVSSEAVKCLQHREALRPQATETFD